MAPVQDLYPGPSRPIPANPANPVNPANPPTPPIPNYQSYPVYHQITHSSATALNSPEPTPFALM